MRDPLSQLLLFTFLNIVFCLLDSLRSGQVLEQLVAEMSTIEVFYNRPKMLSR
jgi:hypothetical protein